MWVFNAWRTSNMYTERFHVVDVLSWTCAGSPFAKSILTLWNVNVVHSQSFFPRRFGQQRIISANKKWKQIQLDPFSIYMVPIITNFPIFGEWSPSWYDFSAAEDWRLGTWFSSLFVSLPDFNISIGRGTFSASMWVWAKMVELWKYFEKFNSISCEITIYLLLLLPSRFRLILCLRVDNNCTACLISNIFRH